MKSTHLTSKGFTIIEALVSIAILTTAILGTMTAVQSSLSSYIFSKDQVAAFYLAQEGFEQLRNIRDENRLNGLDWLTGVAQSSSDPCYFGEACLVSPVETATLTRCSNPGSCPKLRQQASTGFFGYNLSWDESIFQREIVLESVSANEIAVTVSVYWNKGTVLREFVVRENLLNW